jgi:hypothetical protein
MTFSAADDQVGATTEEASVCREGFFGDDLRSWRKSSEELANPASDAEEPGAFELVSGPLRRRVYYSGRTSSLQLNRNRSIPELLNTLPPALIVEEAFTHGLVEDVVAYGAEASRGSALKAATP